VANLTHIPKNKKNIKNKQLFFKKGEDFMKKTFLIFIATFLFSVNLVLAQFPADFDQQFGSTTGGITYESQKLFTSIAKDLNSEIVTAGGRNVNKYALNGTLLKNKNIIRPSGSQFVYTQFSQIKVLPSNEYIVSGTNSINGKEGICMAKLDKNLNLVTSFGQSGISCIRFKYSRRVNDMVIQSDGKIVIVGTTYTDFNDSTTWAQFIARFDVNGNPDATFGRSGFVYESLQGFTQASSVAMLDEKIVVGGINSTQSINHIVVYDKDGYRDTRFNNGNVLFGYGYTIAVQSNQIVVFNRANALSPASLARLKYDGTFDQSFGNGGISNVFMSNTTIIKAIDFDTNGNIIIAGEEITTGPTTFYPLVARLKPNGNLATNFTTSYFQNLPSGLNILDFSILGGDRNSIEDIFIDGTQIYGVNSNYSNTNTFAFGSALFKLNS
jgi:uncharacterized delta-60 repeat protein